jgi:hypothetical protein
MTHHRTTIDGQFFSFRPKTPDNPLRQERGRGFDNGGAMAPGRLDAINSG